MCKTGEYYIDLYDKISKESASVEDDFMFMPIGTLQNSEEKAEEALKRCIGWYIDQANINPSQSTLEINDHYSGKFFAKTNYNNLVYLKTKIRIRTDDLIINPYSFFY